MQARRRILTTLALGAALLSGCTAGESGDTSGEEPSASAAASPSGSPKPTPSDDAASEEGSDTPEVVAPDAGADQGEAPVRPVSVLGLAAQQHRGDRLRLGGVRERTAEYTSYDVTYRSRTSTP